MSKKINVMVDVKIEVDMPRIPYYCRGDLLKTEKYLKDWVSEFHDFIRDHRSQDPVNLNVERVMQDVCSECKREWDIYKEEGKIFCGNCGAEIDSEILTPVK